MEQSIKGESQIDSILLFCPLQIQISTIQISHDALQCFASHGVHPENEFIGCMKKIVCI